MTTSSLYFTPHAPPKEMTLSWQGVTNYQEAQESFTDSNFSVSPVCKRPPGGHHPGLLLHLDLTYSVA